MSWEKIDKSTGPEGTTITYRLEGTPILVQSRKRHIPHAGGSGTWDHTSYWVINRGEEIKELRGLAGDVLDNLAQIRAALGEEAE